MRNKRIFRASRGLALGLAVFLAVPSTALAVSAQFGNTQFTFGGYIKLDTIYSDYSDGKIKSADLGSDFYLPFTIPVEPAPGDTAAEDGGVLDIHARETRFNIATETALGGNTLTSYIELDFLVNTGEGFNESFTSSSNPRLRHAYFTFNDLLLGQTWSTFMNTSALPDTLDFVGAADSTVFIRQAQIRYTAGPLQFALENPQTRVLATADDDGSGNETGDATVPDAVIRYNLVGDWGSLALAALGRQLTDDNTVAVDDEEFGYGLSLSGAIALGSDTFKFALNGGKGAGRYIAFGLVDAVQDGNDLEAIEQLAGFAAYEHSWSDQWRSTLVLSAYEADDEDGLADGNFTEEARSFIVNLQYSPVEPVTFGIEYLYAEREVPDGRDGDMNRIQFSGQYEF